VRSPTQGAVFKNWEEIKLKFARGNQAREPAGAAGCGEPARPQRRRESRHTAEDRAAGEQDRCPGGAVSGSSRLIRPAGRRLGGGAGRLVDFVHLPLVFARGHPAGLHRFPIRALREILSDFGAAGQRQRDQGKNEAHEARAGFHRGSRQGRALVTAVWADWWGRRGARASEKTLPASGAPAR
jgi:hypothetical protein